MKLDEFLSELNEINEELQKERDKQLLTRFAQFLNKRCDLNVANMVRPFMEGE